MKWNRIGMVALLTLAATGAAPAWGVPHNVPAGQRVTYAHPVHLHRAGGGCAQASCCQPTCQWAPSVHYKCEPTCSPCGQSACCRSLLAELVCDVRLRVEQALSCQMSCMSCAVGCGSCCSPCCGDPCGMDCCGGSVCGPVCGGSVCCGGRTTLLGALFGWGPGCGGCDVGCGGWDSGCCGMDSCGSDSCGWGGCASGGCSSGNCGTAVESSTSTPAGPSSGAGKPVHKESVPAAVPDPTARRARGVHTPTDAYRTPIQPPRVAEPPVHMRRAPAVGGPQGRSAYRAAPYGARPAATRGPRQQVRRISAHEVLSSEPEYRADAADAVVDPQPVSPRAAALPVRPAAPTRSAVHFGDQFGPRAQHGLTGARTLFR